MANRFVPVCVCLSRARAILSSSPSKCVDFVPRYSPPSRSSCLSLSVLLGLEQNPPAALSFRPDPSVKPVVHPSSSKSLILISHTTCGVSFVPRSPRCRACSCFLSRLKSHSICLSPFSPVAASISSRQVL